MGVVRQASGKLVYTPNTMGNNSFIIRICIRAIIMYTKIGLPVLNLHTLNERVMRESLISVIKKLSTMSDIFLRRKSHNYWQTEASCQFYDRQ